MTTRALVLVAALVALPLGPARATHCESQIYLFSYIATPADDPLDESRKLGTPTVTSSAIGCTIIGSDDPAIPGDESDTDIVYPGSDTFVVRWLAGGIPASGTLTFDGQTNELAFYETTNGLVPVVDSQQIHIDPVSSVTGGDAVITVCPDASGQDCDTRVYRTLG